MSRPVVVNFIGDASKLNRTIDQTQGKMRGLKTAFGALAGLGIGTALIGGLKSTIDAAKESQAVTRETQTRIKEMGSQSWISAKQVGDLATAISNKTGKDDEAIQSGANMLLTFSKVRNEVGAGNDVFNRATQVATDMAAKFGGDASKQAIVLGKALNDPIKGISALTRIGVTFDAGQKKQIETMVKSGNILGAQKIILGEVGKQTSGAAAASTTGWDKFLVKVGNIQEDLGTKLLPVIDKLADKLMKGIDFVGRNATAFKILGGAVLVTAGFVMAMNVATKVATAAQTAAKVATVGWTIATKALGLAMRLTPLGLIITGITLLVAVIILAYKKSETFRNIVQAVWRVIKNAVLSAVSFIISAFRLWFNIAFTVVQGIIHVFGKLPGPMGAPFRKAEEAVKRARETVNRKLDEIQARVNRLKGKDIPITARPAVEVAKSVRMYLKAANVKGFHAKGARIPGYGGGDIYPAMLEPGEAVVPKEAARRGDFRTWAASMGIPGFQAGGLLGSLGAINVKSPSLAAALHFTSFQPTFAPSFAIDPPVRGYRNGVDFINHDQFAFLHRGESVLTVRENRARRGDTHLHFHGSIYADKDELTKMVRERLRVQLRREGKRELAVQL